MPMRGRTSPARDEEKTTIPQIGTGRMMMTGSGIDTGMMVTMIGGIGTMEKAAFTFPGMVTTE